MLSYCDGDIRDLLGKKAKILNSERKTQLESKKSQLNIIAR